MTGFPADPAQIGMQCPAAIELRGLHVPCPCAEFAARFGTPPPRESCPATETAEQMRRRHDRDVAAARADTARALHQLSRAIRDAENRADALEALARRPPGDDSGRP